MVEVYFATNRNYEGKSEFGTGFHADGPHNVRLGWAEVEPRNADDYVVNRSKITVADEDISQDPDLGKGREKTKLGSREVFERMRKRMIEEGRDIICLIHGFAANFETALARVAEISVDYGTPERPLLGFVFSWPANGSMIPFLDYYSDRHDARASELAIARTFLRLCKFLEKLKETERCDRSIHLVVHSMGNWALRHALDDIIEEFGGRPPRLFDNIFLMAADADNDAFEKEDKFKRLPDICKAVHVYFSKDDRALMTSDITKFNPDRLGATGPAVRGKLPRKVNLIDCQHVDVPDRKSQEPGKNWDLSVHQYYRLRREVIVDVQQVLAGVAPRDIVGRRYMEDDRSFQIIPFSKRFNRR
ncbi:MAG: alpha/beta hydrolase [Proteobacteria bacterium]|nr:alpha/beta hydrolase [Pseudomonadota bacterium]